MRNAEIKRSTAETSISLWVELDGNGNSNVSTGVGFMDHMLTLLTKHAKFDLVATCNGDTYVDDHHSVEDIGICFGKAFAEALGDKRGITRYGDNITPMDEALILTALDISGRAYLAFNVDIPTEKVGTFDTELVEEFMMAFVRSAGVTLHMRKLDGKNSHHIIEGCFKSLARALREAVAIDDRSPDEIPSTKGVIEDVDDDDYDDNYDDDFDYDDGFDDIDDEPEESAAPAAGGEAIEYETPSEDDFDEEEAYDEAFDGEPFVPETPAYEVRDSKFIDDYDDEEAYDEAFDGEPYIPEAGIEDVPDELAEPDEEPDEEVYEEEVYEEPEADEEYKPATEVSFFREYDDDGYDAEAEENSIEDLAEAMARASMRREYGLGSRDSEDEPGYSTGLGDDDYADSIIGGKK